MNNLQSFIGFVFSTALAVGGFYGLIRFFEYCRLRDPKERLKDSLRPVFGVMFKLAKIEEKPVFGHVRHVMNDWYKATIYINDVELAKCETAFGYDENSVIVYPGKITPQLFDSIAKWQSELDQQYELAVIKLTDRLTATKETK